MVASSYTSPNHSQLVMDDDGSWRCLACFRKGSSYTLPSRQPCLLLSRQEETTALTREIFEESLVTTGVSHELIQRTMSAPWLSEWLLYLLERKEPSLSSWLARPSVDFEGRTPIDVVANDPQVILSILQARSNR